jgi:hypothetical protein
VVANYVLPSLVRMSVGIGHSPIYKGSNKYCLHDLRNSSLCLVLL